MTALEQLQADRSAIRILRMRFAHMTKAEADALDRATAALDKQCDLLDDTKYRTVRTVVVYGRGPRYETAALVDMDGAPVSHDGAVASLHEFLQELEVPFEEEVALTTAVISARVPHPAPAEVEGYVE